MNNNDIVPGFDEGRAEGFELRLARLDGLEGGLEIAILGYLNNHNSRYFIERVGLCIDRGYTRLVFDCRRFLYSDAPGFFVSVLKGAKALGGDISFFGLQAQVRYVFLIMGFDGFFKVGDTLDEAVLLLGREYDEASLVSPQPIDGVQNSQRPQPIAGAGFEDLEFNVEDDGQLKTSFEKLQGRKDALVVDLAGAIDNFNVETFRIPLLRAIEIGYVKLAFDCGKLTYLSENAIGGFASLLKTLYHLGGGLAFFALDLKILETFQLLGFSQFFNIRDSRQEAIAALELSAAPGATAPAAGPGTNEEILPGFDDPPLSGHALRISEIGKRGDCLSMRLWSWVDVFPQQAFARRLDLALGSGYRRFVLSVEWDRFRDNEGKLKASVIEAMTRYIAKIKSQGGEAVLVDLHWHDGKEYELGSLENLIEVFRSFDSAEARILAPKARGDPLPKNSRPSAVFERNFACPRCAASASATSPGRLRCPSCGASLRVLASGRAIKW